MKSTMARLLVALFVGLSLVQPSRVAAFSVLDLLGIPPSANVNYRLTIVFEKGGVEYTGSGVIAAQYAVAAFKLPQSFTMTFSYRGEALGVDIPEVGRVFALIIRPRQRTPSIISDACGLGSPYDVGNEEWVRRLRDQFTGICEVPADAFPYFAIFGDPSDATSVRLMTADTLPQGLVVTSASIERTNENPTFGTTDILTWLEDPLQPLFGSVSGQFFQDGKWKRSRHDIGAYTFRDGAP